MNGQRLAVFAVSLVACSDAAVSGEDASSPTRDAGHADVALVHDASAHVMDTGDGDAARAPDATAIPDASDASDADAGVCNQSLFDDSTPPATTSFIEPSQPITPFYQWENNLGYCGETSLLQAAMIHGQWASQYNVRLLCGAAGNGSDAPVGTPLLQTGPAGFCSAHHSTADYNAQMLLEANAAAPETTCAANFHLVATAYDAGANNIGMAGYQDYLSWVKAELIAGHLVIVGVLDRYGSDSQYDHIVTVLRIGTNHAVTDATYYDDDVLYFDDHGGYSSDPALEGGSPSIPPGAGSDASGCTPYVYGYSFASLAATRDQANLPTALGYSILIPGVADSQSHTGGDGVGFGPNVTGHDYGVAVKGSDATDPTLPVSLSITSTTVNGTANPDAPIVGYNYENPFVGTESDGLGCTNAPPPSWMSMTFDVTVSGLTAGASYVLYEYDTPSVAGVADAAALAVPLASFNANASQATAATPFTAAGETYSTTVTRDSSVTIVFRAVLASAP